LKDMRMKLLPWHFMPMEYELSVTVLNFTVPEVCSVPLESVLLV